MNSTQHAHLVVHLARGDSCIAEVFGVAVRGVKAAAGRDAIGWIKHTAKPTGVVVHATATQLQRERAVRGEIYTVLD